MYKVTKLRVNHVTSVKNLFQTKLWGEILNSMKRRLEKNMNQPSTSYKAISLYTSKKRKSISKQDQQQIQQTQRPREKKRSQRRKMLSAKELIEWLTKENYIQGENAWLLGLIDVSTEELYLKNADILSDYSSDLRSFALTLNYYSSDGYNNVRNVFNLSLPHPYTLYNWYKCDGGSPGFTAESLEALKLLASKENGPLYCCLMMDVMPVRRTLVREGNKTIGYEDFGAELDIDVMSEASGVLVFLVTGLNKNWKIPVGYFMIESVNGERKANLVLQCLRVLNDSKISVVSFTFDGCQSNFSMAEILGCKLKSKEMKTTFKHPVTKQPIAIFLDPSSMMEFVRYGLRGYSQFVDGNGKHISWSHLGNLHKLQYSDYSQRFKKHQKNHINCIKFFKQKNKVKLATKLLSKSVADCLDFCRDTIKIADFKESLATAEFIRIFNDLCDLLDSRNFKKLDFTHPLTFKNKTKIMDLLNKAENYIKGLRTPQGEFLTNSTVYKIGFVGLLISIKSTRVLFQFLIEEEKIKYMAMNSFSLVHLKLLFCNLQAYMGNNKEPTAIKFFHFYKKLLKHVEIKTMNDSNHVKLGNISILNFCTAVKIINATTPRSYLFDCVDDGDDDAIKSDINQMPNFDQFSYLLPQMTEIEQFITYTAGYIVRILDKMIMCEECNSAISLTRPGTGHIKIAYFKDEDGLVYPSKDIIKICKVAEFEIQISVIYKSYKLYNTKPSISKHRIINKVLRYCIDRNVFNNLAIHQFDQLPTENHLVHLIKAIAGAYIDVRFRYLSEFLELQSIKHELYSSSIKK